MKDLALVLFGQVSSGRPLQPHIDRPRMYRTFGRGGPGRDPYAQSIRELCTCNLRVNGTEEYRFGPTSGVLSGDSRYVYPC